MTKHEFFLTHSLVKVFPNYEPERLKTNPCFTGLKNEKIHFQIAAYIEEITEEESLQFEVIGPLSSNIRVRQVVLIPSEFPAYEEADDNYISTEPGNFPDLLMPLEDHTATIKGKGYHSFWIDYKSEDEGTAGTYQMEVKVIMNGEITKLPFVIDIIDIALPKQDIIHTQWFHSDCIADYYKVPVFSEEHWDGIDKFIQVAVKECAMNTILTPIFTPPLDTEVGGERTTVQLLDVEIVDDTYIIGYDKLIRWCDICRKHGVEYLEMAHFFTQWGANATPKIIAKVNGEEKRIFGWDVAAISEEYRKFLEALLPELMRQLELCGYDCEHVMFHVSDEPEGHNLESYQAAKAQVEDLLDGYNIMDALSDFEFYQKGVVKTPIVANDKVQAFIDHGVTNLWVYYCCAQKREVPNRFFSMPSARNRIMGVLMYLYEVKGFLQWGYNFYNTRLSIEHIDPYVMTHAGYAFPSGDAFLVYPGKDRMAYTSIRAEVQTGCFQDIRAFQLLEKLTSREYVVSLIYEGIDEVITFHKYPKDTEYLFNLRNKVNDAIKGILSQTKGK